MKTSLPVAPLITAFLASGLIAGETRIVLPDSTLNAPVSVIYIQNRSRRSTAKLPPRPIAQTVIGIILCSQAVVSAGIGTYYFIEADKARKDPDTDDISRGIDATLDAVFGTMYMITAGGYLIPGTILSVAAKKRWDTFNAAKASLGLKYDPYRNAVGAVARIDF